MTLKINEIYPSKSLRKANPQAISKGKEICKRSAGAPCLGFDFGELELLMFF